MESFNIKLATPKQVSFREYDEHYRYTDIELNARFVMSVDVSDFDGGKYKDASEVITAVKSDPQELLQKCMRRLPDGKSVVMGFKTLIPDALDVALSDMGITAKSQICGFFLSGESEKEYHEKMLHERPWSEGECGTTDSADPAYPDAQEDESERTARESGYYKVFFQGYGANNFSSDQKFYAPGNNVEVIYSNVISDTRYEFYVTVRDFNVKYDDRNFYRITFVMPDHDVEISHTTQDLRMYNSVNDNYNGFTGMMLQNFEKQPDEWFCTECGHKNKGGNFCPECGTKKL